MRNKKVIVAAFIALAVAAFPAQAQVQSAEDIDTPTPQFQDHGGVTPWFWIGLQTVFGAGYNIETTAGGFRNYGGDNHTYASFNLAFVDSHYQTPKFYEVPRNLDGAWTGHFVLLNFTSRLNSWESGNTGMENNAPAWLAEITGKGTRTGFFTQAGALAGGITDPDRTEQNNSRPILKIAGGNKVINLGPNQLGRLYYEKSADADTVTIFSTPSPTPSHTSGAIMYTGYEKQELFNVFLTMLSEGNVNSDVRNDRNRGFAGVIDFGASPFGLIADDENPLTFNVTGNAIAALGNFSGLPAAHAQDNVGFGLKGEAGFWLGDNLVLAPVVAFDGKINTDNDFSYKFGGGLAFQFSGMRWVEDEWGDLYRSGSNFADHRYENNKILKYAYAQAYGAYSKASNFNMLFRVEEPDGEAGFHDKLGFMWELRLYNMGAEDADLSWETQMRASWDLNIKQFTITPYVRGYLNNDQVVKLRLGAYANLIPFTQFELAYTSANLNWNAETTQKPLPHYGGIGDAGRVELLVILKSDEIRPQVPKRMSDWNYPNTIQDF